MSARFFSQAAYFLIFALFIFLRSIDLFWLPGLHFDEAWQVMHAHRILSDADFWPSSAMNAYTWPVIHYILAGVYRFAGTSLQATRFFYLALNCASFLLLTRAVSRFWGIRTTFIAALLITTLPSVIHDHRFFIEMTGFFGFLSAVIVYLLSRPTRLTIKTAVLIAVLGAIGTHAHILFYFYMLAGAVVCFATFPTLRSDRAWRV